LKILFDGVREFSKNDFEKYKELFKQLSTSQQPHTLFIGCSDSRVVPDLITKSLPGDLFVIRNVAN
jgi:carbonic anhydrase